MQLAQILNELMLKNNDMSAYKLSKETGISDRLIGYWRKGEKLPSAENIVILATYFGISTDYLLGLNDKMPLFPKNSEEVFQLDEQQQRLLNNYNMLNEDGKESLLNYSDVIIGNPKYLKENGNHNKIVS